MIFANNISKICSEVFEKGCHTSNNVQNVLICHCLFTSYIKTRELPWINTIARCKNDYLVGNKRLTVMWDVTSHNSDKGLQTILVLFHILK